MKLFLTALVLTTGIQTQAVTNTNFDIQKFPGKVKIEADINISNITNNALDILFVVDNSGSMGAHQKNLSDASSTIDKALSQMNRDFHIGVISTDVQEPSWSNYKPGQLRGSPKIITPKDMPGALAKNLVLGTEGSADESPLQSIYLALSEPRRSGDNSDFLRAGASLALVILTDAEDQSSVQVSELTNLLDTVTGDIRRVTVFSWIVPSNITNSNCRRDDNRSTPQRIEDFTKTLNGEVYDICDMNSANITNFVQKLANFGLTSTPNPGAPSADISEIPLTIQPVVSTIEVRYGTQVLAGGDLQEGWVYDSAKNAILLGQKVPWTYQQPGTKLEVSFVPLEWTK